MTRMLVLLDRDGVINQDSPEYIKSVSEWLPLDGSLEAIAELKRAGMTVAICTNQSGIGRGLFSRSTLDAIHQRLEQSLGQISASLDGIYYCPHLPAEGCACRKPEPGLLLQAIQDLSVPGEPCYFIGDSASDLAAASNANCTGLLVRTGKGQITALQNPDIRPDRIFKNLKNAAECLIKTLYNK